VFISLVVFRVYRDFFEPLPFVMDVEHKRFLSARFVSSSVPFIFLSKLHARTKIGNVLVCLKYSYFHVADYFVAHFWRQPFCARSVPMDLIGLKTDLFLKF